MFVVSSCEPLPSLFKLCLCGPKMAPPWVSHVLFVEVLHPVNLVNITQFLLLISLIETSDLSKFIAGL